MKEFLGYRIDFDPTHGTFRVQLESSSLESKHLADCFNFVLDFGRLYDI